MEPRYEGCLCNHPRIFGFFLPTQPTAIPLSPRSALPLAQTEAKASSIFLKGIKTLRLLSPFPFAPAAPFLFLLYIHFIRHRHRAYFLFFLHFLCLSIELVDLIVHRPPECFSPPQSFRSSGLFPAPTQRHAPSQDTPAPQGHRASPAW